MDILVGWHIDHTQKPSLTQQVSGKFGQRVSDIVHSGLQMMWVYLYNSGPTDMEVDLKPKYFSGYIAKTVPNFFSKFAFAVLCCTWKNGMLYSGYI